MRRYKGGINPVPASTELLWQRRRLWLAPPVSPLTERAVSVGSDTVVMTCDMGAIQQHYLRDHQASAMLASALLASSSDVMTA